jgi:hypothetical protein
MLEPVDFPPEGPLIHSPSNLARAQTESRSPYAVFAICIKQSYRTILVLSCPASSIFVLQSARRLDGVLGLGSAGTGVGRVLVTGELDLLGAGEIEDVLEPLADLFQPLLALKRVSALNGGLALGLLASGAGPQTDTPESLADVDDDTHDLVVLLVLKGLANGSEHDVEPSLIVGLAVLEGVGPATTVLVLGVLPLGAHALLEEVVVRLLRKLRSRGDVVLRRKS